MRQEYDSKIKILEEIVQENEQSIEAKNGELNEQKYKVRYFD